MSMTGNQIKDILDGINVSLLRLNDRINKLEAAKENASNGKIALDDDDYVLDDEAGWFDVGPFTVRMNMREGDLNIRVYDRKLANDHDFELGELESLRVHSSDCE